MAPWTPEEGWVLAPEEQGEGGMERKQVRGRGRGRWAGGVDMVGALGLPPPRAFTSFRKVGVGQGDSTEP